MAQWNIQTQDYLNQERSLFEVNGVATRDGKIVDDFNILDENHIHTLNVSATQQLHRIIMEQKNEINDLDHD